MKKVVAAVFFVTFLAGLLACSGSGGIVDTGPTDQQIKQIFEGALKKSIPVNWAGSYAGGKLQKIEFLEIKRGKSIKQMNGGRLPEVYAAYSEDCWPVNMHVKGTALASMFFSKEVHHFEDQTSFVLCKKYDGTWGIDPGDKLMVSEGF